jgi:hypothetical protein
LKRRTAAMRGSISVVGMAATRGAAVYDIVNQLIDKVK